MICEHLQLLESEILKHSVKEIWRGKAWSKNCNEWVYYDCYLNNEMLRKKIIFSDCVIDHKHLGTHDGQESGFVCTKCNDGIMGSHIRYSGGLKVIE